MPFEKLYMQVTKSKCRYDAVIFDLDGTIANTFPTVLRIFNRIVSDRTGRQLSFEEWQQYLGPPETTILRQLFPDEAEQQSVIDDYFRMSSEDGDEIRAHPGIEALISSLHQAGVPLAVYSGANQRSATMRIGHTGLLKYFDVVLGGDEVERHKPDPEGLFRLLDHFRVAPESTIYIGDMVVDILAGKAAGMRTAAVTWGFNETEKLRAAAPDYLIEKTETLEAILFT